MSLAAPLSFRRSLHVPHRTAPGLPPRGPHGQPRALRMEGGHPGHDVLIHLLHHRPAALVRQTLCASHEVRPGHRQGPSGNGGFHHTQKVRGHIDLGAIDVLFQRAQRARGRPHANPRSSRHIQASQFYLCVYLLLGRWREFHISEAEYADSLHPYAQFKVRGKYYQLERPGVTHPEIIRQLMEIPRPGAELLKDHLGQGMTSGGPQSQAQGEGATKSSS